MNYGELKTQFTGLLKRRDVTASQIETWLQMSMKYAQRLLRVPAMEKSALITIDNTEIDGTLPVPSDLLALKAITIDAEQVELRRKPLQEVLRARVNTGTPVMFAQRGATFVLGMYPTDGLVVRIDYWAELGALEDDEDENWLSVIAEDVITNGAMTFACRYFIDKRLDGFKADFLEGIAQLNDQGASDELSNAAVAPSVEFNDEGW